MTAFILCGTIHKHWRRTLSASTKNSIHFIIKMINHSATARSSNAILCLLVQSSQIVQIFSTLSPIFLKPSFLHLYSNSLFYTFISHSSIQFLLNLSISPNSNEFFTFLFIQMLPLPVLPISQAHLIVLAENGQGIKTRKGGGNGVILPNNVKTICNYTGSQLYRNQFKSVSSGFQTSSGAFTLECVKSFTCYKQFLKPLLH